MADAGAGAGTSPERWLGVRRALTGRRAELGAVAARLYPDVPRAAGTELLARPDWLPATPVDLNAVRLAWEPHPPAPAVDPAGPLTAGVRPRCSGSTPHSAGQRYATYAAAIEALDRPALYENRVCYRALSADLVRQPSLTFGGCRYFDGVSLGHAVAHETAAAWLAGPQSLRMRGLPLRAAVGDPCDLAARPAIVAVTTLTLRREPGGGASFLLHWRDPARVNHAGGLYQVMPAGIFQPVTDTRAALHADLDLWRCMAREYSEELLGTAEEYPVTDGLLDYGSWPFYRRLTAARTAGGLAVWCVGAGVDPLTLASDLLTVAVFDAAVFDAVFGGLVAANAEGRVVTSDGSAAIPFTQAAIDRFTGGAEPVQAAGAALLRLAWQHRRHLLG